MIDISIKNVVKSFEIGAPLLDGFSMELREGERVGLLGRNGCGKTTLFRMITGQLLPDEGEITVAAGKRIGLISQIPWYPEEYTVENVLRSAFAELFALKKKMAQLEREMAEGSTPAQLSQYDSLVNRYETGGGYDDRHRGGQDLQRPGDPGGHAAAALCGTLRRGEDAGEPGPAPTGADGDLAAGRADEPPGPAQRRVA